MVNVVVSRKRNIKVSANATAGVIDTSVPVTIKNTPVIPGGAASRLDKMLDVDPAGETNGATLVYEAASDKYIVKKIDLADVTGGLDGGTF